MLFNEFFKTDTISRITKIARFLTKIVMLIFVAIPFDIFQEKLLKTLIMIVIGKLIW